MKASWTAVVLIVSICLGGCGPTPYQRARVPFGQGYADKIFSDDTFHVAFTANYTTSATTLREYLYRRAAELTLQHKFRYFTVIREPRPLAKYKIIYRSEADREAGIDAEDVELPAQGTLHMTIQCFQDASPVAETPLLDAQRYRCRSTDSSTWVLARGP